MSLSNIALDAFTAICKYRTVLEASKHLGVTQTAVTQRIRTLEKDLEDTLFIRTRKGMIPTETGQKLLEYCKQKNILENRTVSLIKNQSITQPIRVSFCGSTHFMHSRVIPHTKSLKEDFPQLYFSFDINDSEDKLQILKEGKSDIIFLPREDVPLELDSKLLKSTRYILVGGKDAYKKKKDFQIIDFSPRDPFTTMFFKKLKIKFNEIADRHYINNTMMLPSLLEQNLGVAVLSIDHYREAKKQHDIYNIFPDKYYELEWAMAWYPRTETPEYFEKIIKCIK